MKTLIKNCGLKTADAIHEAARTGATFIGFVHHLESPRHLDLETMAKLSREAPETLRQVVVLVDPSNDMLEEVLHSIQPNYLQVHRVEKPERIRDINKRTGIPIITGIRVRDSFNLAHVAPLEEVSEHLLFDSYDPEKAGGSGRVFNWAVLDQLHTKKPWFLAGGLTAENVAEAIKSTRAQMVDVSSGIEDSPGVKSLEKIAAFNAAVLRSS